MNQLKQLSRAEMKHVLGGVAQKISCPVSVYPGYITSGGYTCEGEDANACQASADKWCMATKGCSNVDCPGAD